jgi:hypothetical protein
VKSINRAKYIEIMRNNSVKTSGAFLNLNALADDVLRRLSGSSLFANGLTRVGIVAALIALLLALYAILVPIAYGVSSEFMSRKEDVQNIQREIEQMKGQQEKMDFQKLQQEVDQLKNRKEELQEQQKDLGFRIEHFSH